MGIAQEKLLSVNNSITSSGTPCLIMYALEGTKHQSSKQVFLRVEGRGKTQSCLLLLYTKVRAAGHAMATLRLWRLSEGDDFNSQMNRPGLNP
jgi:hypothetical protein